MFFWKHYFYSVFSKTQLFKNKNCMMKKTENLWKIVGCFWTWKIVFLVFFVLRLYTYCGLFLCVYHKSAKNACFPQFFGFFLGWLLLLYLGLEGLYVLVFFFWSSFWCGFGFSLALFCFVLGCCCFCLCFFGLFFSCFFGGFKGQVRWPEGPPHLALNPPFSFCFFFCFFFFLFFLFLFFSLSFLALF